MTSTDEAYGTDECTKPGRTCNEHNMRFRSTMSRHSSWHMQHAATALQAMASIPEEAAAGGLATRCWELHVRIHLHDEAGMASNEPRFGVHDEDRKTSCIEELIMRIHS